MYNWLRFNFCKAHLLLVNNTVFLMTCLYKSEEKYGMYYIQGYPKNPFYPKKMCLGETDN
jgi:hypothetical protein